MLSKSFKNKLRAFTIFSFFHRQLQRHGNFLLLSQLEHVYQMCEPARFATSHVSPYAGLVFENTAADTAHVLPSYFRVNPTIQIDNFRYLVI